jgi:ADP-heptose:LPS heptosyltransferase
MYRKKQDLLHYNFLLQSGGVGDLIAQLPALKYVLDFHPHIFMHLWVQDYGVELAKKVLPGYKNLIVKGLSEGKKKYNNLLVARSPYVHKVDNLATHLTDHAFFTLAHTIPENKYKNYIQLDPIDVSHFNLPEKYVVITTGFTSETRKWLPEHVNKLTDWLVHKSIVPVYLGRSFTPSHENDGIIGHFDCNRDNGIDLVDNTSLFEAHSIMSKAIAVCGLDNGLLHLAAMSNVPIVGGFTSVDPIHRMPYRNNVMGYNYYPVYPKGLSCIGCQSNMVFVSHTHDFRNCFWKDYACLDLMKAELFIEQLEKIMNKSKTPEEKATEAFRQMGLNQELNRKIKEILGEEETERRQKLIRQMTYDRTGNLDDLEKDE